MALPFYCDIRCLTRRPFLIGVSDCPLCQLSNLSPDRQAKIEKWQVKIQTANPFHRELLKTVRPAFF